METRKPSYDEWMYWTQVMVDRLTAIIHAYGHPPYDDAFMAEKERQDKMAQALAAMRYLHELTDNFELSLPKDASDMAEREETLLQSLAPAFQEILGLMPRWSADMQFLLKSPWATDCIGRAAQTLFRGPDGQLAQGLGTGLAENGRLPEVVATLIDREAAGDDRAPRAVKPERAPSRMRRAELARLWGRQNSAFLATAGRVD